MKKLSNKIKGYLFEKEAFIYLKKNYKKVIWLSRKNFDSKIDFVAYDNENRRFLIEAKYNSRGKPILSKSQAEYADYIIYKIGENGDIKLQKNNKIYMKDNSNFNPMIDIELIEKYMKIQKIKGRGSRRLRPVVKCGKYKVILLYNIDVKDLDLKIGKVVDIDDLVPIKEVNKK